MRYKLKPIHCRPWTLSYLSVKLIESHYENNYGGAGWKAIGHPVRLST
jgi:Fe-Mn family superoxide dismutase